MDAVSEAEQILLAAQYPYRLAQAYYLTTREKMGESGKSMPAFAEWLHADGVLLTGFDFSLAVTRLKELRA